MRTIVETKTVYLFDELEEDAKETARNWFRQSIETDELEDYDDFQQVAAILGISFKEKTVRLMGGGHRGEPVIYWSGFSSQGDGARFEGAYEYKKGAAKRIREYAPGDSELHRIADELQKVQQRYFYRLCATMGTGHGSNFYSHSGTMSVDVEEYNGRWIPDLVEGEVRDLMRCFADWIYRRIEAQYDYLMSEESVDESIRANDYEFTESGVVA